MKTKSLTAAIAFAAVIAATTTLEAKPGFNSADKPFVPAVVPKKPASAKLRLIPEKRMALIEASLDGRECTLLFDTGATHTTFDIGFMKRELPGVALSDVMLGGKTNVKKAPKIFHASSLKIGGSEFKDFKAMTIDLSSLSALGAKIDGIIGMNVIGSVPTIVSFGSKSVMFAPGTRERSRFGKGIGRDKSKPFSVALAPVYKGKKFDLIIDSASSLTFFGKTLGWPLSGQTRSFFTVDVNGRSEIKMDKGKPDKLDLGENTVIEPLIVDGPVSRIGADTLLKYDILIEPEQVRFAKTL